MLDRSVMRRRGTVIVAALVLCLVVAGSAVAAIAVTSGGGTTGKVDFATSQVLLETPANVYQKVTTMDITTSSGPVLVRFDAQAYEDDYNSGGNFDGTHYAAMLVRVLLDGVAIPPGAVRYTTNEGKRNVNDLSGQTASFSWATMASSGKHTIQVDFRNLNQFDLAGLVRWTLTADHG